MSGVAKHFVPSAASSNAKAARQLSTRADQAEFYSKLEEEANERFDRGEFFPVDEDYAQQLMAASRKM